MSGIDGLLNQVESLVMSANPAEADERLRSLLTTMGPVELRVWEPDLRLTIEKFLPKRRKGLTSLLDQLLQAKEQAPEKAEQVRHQSASAAQMLDDLEHDLLELSERHIFQWSTFYRDYLSEFFARFVTDVPFAEIRSTVNSVRILLDRHVRETFLKGYRYNTQYDSQQYAIGKSISGLQRFVELPVEFYSARLSADLHRTEAIALRSLTSGMLCGIIEGYSSLRFDDVSANEILSEYARTWGYVLAFMTGEHAEAAVNCLSSGDFRKGANSAVIPVTHALDRLAETGTDYIPLPALSQLLWQQRRLDISLRPPPYAPDRRPVEVQCYLDGNSVASYFLTEALNREVGAILAPLRPDLRDFVASNERLNQICVQILDVPDSEAITTSRLILTLEHAIYRRRSPRVGSQPLEYNFAKEFPLHNPFLAVYYHVYRTSVRDLLRTFERRNGVRLWCSVRRSGKTTAGFDLGTTTGESNVISQTCDLTEQVPGANLLYDEICSSLARGDQLPNDFFSQTINRCMLSGQASEHRTVLVLDEYETLFGQLSTAVEDKLRLRYTVVQPLLNQMVAFSRENLLVFLGQQPNAHYILMDQNQLSPYVQQDSFPLFAHESGVDGGEFGELLRKILSNRVAFDQSFVDRVFVETSGHPYLTANLMVEFVDWLIRRKRPANSLSFTASDFASFASTMLRRNSISVSAEYGFFRDAVIRDALSTRGKGRNPWLYAIYSMIRSIALENPESFVCSRAEFVELVTRLGMGGMGITPDYLLTTGVQANFLTFSTVSVGPRIRLLARIAAAATPEVNP